VHFRSKRGCHSATCHKCSDYERSTNLFPNPLPFPGPTHGCILVNVSLKTLLEKASVRMIENDRMSWINEWVEKVEKEWIGKVEKA
jgi:hypothetical protein